MIVHKLKREDYCTTWHAMREFTNNRTLDTPDEIWFVEHNSVFTQGQNGRPEHLLNQGNIPLVKTDRGGQITWHGPGQLIAYTLIDIKRLKLNVRTLVTVLERAIIRLLATFDLKANAKKTAPGVYINDKKIASIGLRIRRGCSYHGLALNIDPDLSAFKQINPCGFSELSMTKLVDYVTNIDRNEIEQQLANLLIEEMSYNKK